MTMTRLRESWAFNFPFDQVSLHSLFRSKLNLDPLQGLKQAVICDDTTADGGPGKLRKVTPGSGSTTCNEEEIEQVLCSVSGFSFIDGMILGFQAWLQFVSAFAILIPLLIITKRIDSDICVTHLKLCIALYVVIIFWFLYHLISMNVMQQSF